MGGLDEAKWRKRKRNEGAKLEFNFDCSSMGDGWWG